MATLSMIILAGLIIVSISPTLYFERWTAEEGDLVTHDVVAPFSIRVVDRQERDEFERSLRENVPRIYKMDVGAAARVLERLGRIFSLIQQTFPEGTIIDAPEEPNSDTSQRLADLDLRIENAVGVNFERDVLLALVRSRNSTQLREEIENAFRYLLLHRGVVRDGAATMLLFLERGQVEIEHIAGPRPLNFDEHQVLDASDIEEGLNQYLRHHSLQPNRAQREARALRAVVRAMIVPNIWADSEETAQREAAELAALNPGAYTDTYEKGEVIAAAGYQLTRKQELALRAVDARKPYYLLMNFLGNTALVVSLLLFLIFYLRRYRRDWSYTTANVYVIGLPLVLALALARIGLLVLPDDPVAGYLFPAGALGMLGVILIGPRVGLLLTFMGCCLFGFMTQMDFHYMMIGIVGGAAAVASLIQLRRRRDILRAGLIAGIANAVAILVLQFIDNPALTLVRNWELLGHMGWGLGNGLACSMITLMSLVVFEYLFRVTTDLNLIELTSVKTPLLRELEEKTPGTYQHTLNVAALAEAAAEATGANYLLVRAGAHYHDIGKMAKPKYFTENQVTAEDRRLHGKLSPSLSALIIKEHVKRGIDLAEQHRLPTKLIDFIPQHHGTSLIKYFHTEAQRRFALGETADPVREDEFRYPGPKPQSVETAILMLADATEATATSKITGSSVRRDDIELIVRDTIREKFNDGQLDECNLTLADLKRIRESLVKSLLGRYHQRVDYPAAATAVVRGA
jgi:hypothetical protein